VHLYRAECQLRVEVRDDGVGGATPVAGSGLEGLRDRAPTYPRVLDELLPAARHIVGQYANNPIEADHGRLKSRLRPMRGLKRLAAARVISTGHAFLQN
jgi:transposase, IS6 family